MAFGPLRVLQVLANNGEVEEALMKQYAPGFLTKAGVFLLTVPGGALQAPAAWTAYNDMAWASGQTNYRITHLSFMDDADHDYSGQLLR